MVLKDKLEYLLLKEVGPERQVRCDDTEVKVSVSDRTQRNLVKRFGSLDISWTAIAKQLETWIKRFRSGKKLRVDFVFQLRRHVAIFRYHSEARKEARVVGNTEDACRAGRTV